MNANTAIIEIGQFSVESSQLGTRAGGFEAKHEDEEVLVDRRVEILAKAEDSEEHYNDKTGGRGGGLSHGWSRGGEMWCKS